MIPFSLFLSLKYLKPNRSFISIVTLISILGVVIGVAILIIVMSVMEGFGVMWREKIISYSAHVSVSSVYGVMEHPEGIAEKVESIPGITHAIPYIETITLIRSDAYLEPALVSGYDPAQVGLVSAISSNITAGACDLSEGHVVVGLDLANSLGISVGDIVLVYTPKCVTAEDELHLPEELTVSGIFNMGMAQYDARFVLTSLDTARELHGIEQGAIELRVTTEDHEKAGLFAKAIEEKLGPEYRTMTWMDMRPDLFSALTVEKNLMRFLLAFIAVVAFFCVANNLIVVTVNKTKEIGLLKALGFPTFKIMAVFTWHAVIQCVLGTIGGIGAGLLILHYRNNILRAMRRMFDFELFPKSIYELDKLPSVTTWQDIRLITLLVFVFCLLASIIPAWRAAKMSPVDAIRND
jgi:lipoprotein-releasing system permease protein